MSNVELVEKWCKYKNLEFPSPCLFQARKQPLNSFAQPEENHDTINHNSK
jgi:hypothetical protein